jgi:hypothetical protein
MNSLLSWRRMRARLYRRLGAPWSWRGRHRQRQRHKTQAGVEARPSRFRHSSCAIETPRARPSAMRSLTAQGGPGGGGGGSGSGWEHPPGAIPYCIPGSIGRSGTRLRRTNAERSTAWRDRARHAKMTRRTRVWCLAEYLDQRGLATPSGSIAPRPWPRAAQGSESESSVPGLLRLVFITERWRMFLFPDSAASEVALFRAWSCFALGPPALRAVAVCVRHDGQQLLARLVNLSRILMSRRRLNVIGSN